MSTNSDYNSASRSNPCPVCGAVSGCKELATATQLTWFCRAASGTAKGDKIPGVDGQLWHSFGPAGDGIWGQLSPDRKQIFSEADKAKHDAELARKRVEVDRRRQEKLARELKEGGRDTAYRGILGELGLSEGDRSNLRDRGFSPEQIDAVRFRSVDKWQKVSGDYPENLPGHNSKNKSLIVPRPGILCPVPNHQGLIVGWQVRFNEVAEGQQRYMWAKDAQLNGEMPIACWDKQSRHSDEIWAIEGTGIKPALAHFKHGYPVIGASGGLFESSAKNFRETWEFLKSKHGTNKLVVAVDGGDVVNPNVVSRLERQFVFFNQLNIDVSIGWWGQVYKEGKNDIDEIANLDNISRISVEEFRVILKQYKKERGNNKKTVALKLVKAERDTPTLIKPRPFGWEPWTGGRKYTPNVIIESEYFDYQAPIKNQVLAIKSPVGTGKTQFWGRLFEKGGKLEGKKLISFFSRNSLIDNVVPRIEGLTKLSEELSMMVKDPQGRIALCTNSIKKFSNPEWFDDAVIVIDEWESVMSHILTSRTHRRDRTDALNLIMEAFKRADRILLMDGNMSDRAVNYAASLAPDKQVLKVENTYIQARADVDLYMGTPRKSGKFDSSKLAPFLYPIFSCSRPILILADSQALLESIEKTLKEAGKIGLRIDSKTNVPDSEENRCLRDVNGYIREKIAKGERFDYLMGSPTMGVGVDINIPGYFSDSYVIARGVLGVDDLMQLAGRCRDPKTVWHISCPERSTIRSESLDDGFDIGKIAQSMADFALQDLSYLKSNTGMLQEQFLQWIEEAKENPHVYYAIMLKAKEAFEKRNLRECLQFALEQAGHKVKLVCSSELAKLEAELKNAKEEVKLQESQEIFAADDITLEEAEKLSKSYSSNWEERKQVKKAAYKKLLPGIEETELWNVELIHYLRWDNPDAIRQAGLFHLFHHPERAFKQQTNVWAKIAAERQVFLPDLKSQNLRVEALKFLEFERFLNPDAKWHKDSPEILELVERGTRDRVVTQLGKVPKDTKGGFDGLRYLRKLLEMVGLALGKCQRERIDGRQIRFYQLDIKILNSPIRNGIQEAVDRRYEEFDREWIKPEVFEVAAQKITCTPDVEPEPETDDGGVDWRGIAMQVKQAVGQLIAGDRVEADGQPRDNGVGGWLIWVKSAIGRFQLDFEMLELAFD